MGSQSLATYSYTQDGYNRLETLDYGNGDSVEYIYSSDGSLARQTYEDNAKVSYQYNNDGNLAVVKDTQTGRTTRYDYDLTDRLTKVTESATGHTFSQSYSYDSSNRLSSSSEVTQGTTRNITYTYDDDNRISVYKKAALSQNFVYDSLGRTKQRIAKNGDTTLLTTTFAFATVDGNATGLVSGMRNRSESGAYNKPYYYTYDDNGNLLSIGDGTYTTTYEYDESNQLIRENNQEKGYTHVWIYNSAGNIRFKKVYDYTTAATLGTPNETITYNYNNTNWQDQLSTFDGRSYTYDAIGNMLTGGGRTYTWKHGRQLATLTQGGTTWTNTYNADGLRTQRTDGTNTYKYYYSDGKLICMYRNSTRSFFAYTPDGLPYYMTYGGKYYVYALNLQGDVMAILDDTGKAVVEYTYDAWGNILSITGDLASTVGAFNPLRYRGYVYDNETQLYYLQSRYYDPEIGRFISADKFVSTGQGILGHNMYAYCGNNPVIHKDPTGEFSWVVFAVLAVCAAAGGLLGYFYEGELGAHTQQKDVTTPTKPVPPNQIEKTLPNNDNESDMQSQNKTEKTTTKQRVKNTLIGVGLGLATGGALVATGGAAGSVITGSASSYISLFGATGAQTTALGAAIYDVFAMVVAPFFGVEMETIEIEP